MKDNLGLGKTEALGYLMVLAATGMNRVGGMRFTELAPAPTKKCRRCGKEHNHHNLWCSAECCKADKKRPDTQ